MNTLPTREAILKFVAAADGNVTRRDIAREFDLRGVDRAGLRALLKEMAEDGALESSGRRRFVKPGTMPPVAPVDVIGVDDDGDLKCAPANWSKDTPPPLIKIFAKEAAKKKPVPGVGDRLLARLSENKKGFYSAKIIRAIGKGSTRILAIFRKLDHQNMAEPVDRRERNSFTIEENDRAGAVDGDLVWIETKNARGYGPKRARVRAVEGNVDAQNAHSMIAIANHGIAVDFPQDVLDEADTARLPKLDDHRTDLRDMPLLTIDPADAKDHDDALWAAPDDDPENEGGYKVVVAIADVSYFVPSGGALDREAKKRGNSTYFPDRVVPMLPEQLSNNLCSLRVDEDRPCLAVELVLTATGVKKSHRFMRAIMRSAAKLSYEDAQAIIDNQKNSSPSEQAVFNLFRAYKNRMIERKKRSPLDLELPERKILLSKDGAVVDIVKRERFDAHKLVEEFMILANVAAAETLERLRTPLIYRIHDQPDPEKLDGARVSLGKLGYSLVKGGSVRPANFNQILKIAEERGEKEEISDTILRTQRQAVYATENVGHFGLNLPRYAHFTSPIRRYADLIVHRALITADKLGNDGLQETDIASLNDTAQSISDLERRSMSAEREATDRFLASHLSDQVGEMFQARVRGVTRFGLFVMLDQTGADGFIPIKTLGDDYFVFHEKEQMLIGERSGGIYRLGQHVEVRLVEATPVNGGLRFEMLTDPIKGDKKSKSKSRSTSKSSDRKKSGDKNSRNKKSGSKKSKPRNENAKPKPKPKRAKKR